MAKPAMTTPTVHPFFKADFSKFMDISKMMTAFKMPNIDIGALMEMQRKNIETITAINQTAFENLQSFAQRQAEFMRQGFEETTHLVNSVISASTLQEKVERQAEASKIVVEKYMANGLEAAETLAKCNTHAMEAVSNRMSDGLEELRGLIKTDIAA